MKLKCRLLAGLAAGALALGGSGSASAGTILPFSPDGGGTVHELASFTWSFTTVLLDDGVGAGVAGANTQTGASLKIHGRLAGGTLETGLASPTTGFENFTFVASIPVRAIRNNAAGTAVGDKIDWVMDLDHETSFDPTRNWFEMYYNSGGPNRETGADFDAGTLILEGLASLKDGSFGTSTALNKLEIAGSDVNPTLECKTLAQGCGTIVPTTLQHSDPTKVDASTATMSGNLNFIVEVCGEDELSTGGSPGNGKGICRDVDVAHEVDSAYFPNTTFDLEFNIDFVGQLIAPFNKHTAPEAVGGGNGSAEVTPDFTGGGGGTDDATAVNDLVCEDLVSAAEGPCDVYAEAASATSSFTVSVPEPSVPALLGMGLMALGATVRRRRKR